jgi:hypothetical protein
LCCELNAACVYKNEGLDFGVALVSFHTQICMNASTHVAGFFKIMRARPVPQSVVDALKRSKPPSRAQRNRS